MLDCVIICHNNTFPHISTSVTTVFQEYVLMDSLYLSPPGYDLLPEFKELLWGIHFKDISELFLVVIWEIRWLNKNQLLHGTEMMPEH